MNAAPAFDVDWADPAEWVALYRDLGFQVVPCHRPAGATDVTWKRPKLATWAQFATDPIPDTLYERWYGTGGEFAAQPADGHDHGRGLRANRLHRPRHRQIPRICASGGTACSTVENYGEEPETWKAVSGSGGRHLFFRYPPGFAMPTIRTAIGVDVRGQGGFIVLPPSVHNNGRAYEWEDGFAPWQTDIATAPEWLIVAIEELIRQAWRRRQEPRTHGFRV